MALTALLISAVGTRHRARGSEMAKLIVMGDIQLVEDHDLKEITEIPMALVIQFDSPEDIRQAIGSGKCEFDLYEPQSK